jgi:hypothetical protein
MIAYRTFIDRRLYRIHGFMHPTDAMIFSTILDYQNRNSLSGGCVEIGVFYGRSFALMAQFLQKDECALGIDLFDIGERADAQSAQLKAVRDMLHTEGLDAHTHLFKRDSAQITADEITNVVGTTRFFSIDGGHELHHVRCDSALALQTLAPHGVIAFDDFFNPQYPDVTVAVLQFLKEQPDLAAFCITKNKLYVARASEYKRYLEAAKSAAVWGNAYHECFSFLGREIIHWNQSLINRALYQKSAELGLGNLGDLMTRRSLRIFVR